MRHLLLCVVVAALGCFSEPPTVESVDAGTPSDTSGSTSSAPATVSSGASGLPDDSASATVGSGAGSTTDPSSGSDRTEPGGSSGTSTGIAVPLFDVFDNVCDAEWSSDGFTPLPCPTMGMNADGAIRQVDAFDHPELRGSVRALIVEPPVGNQELVQGVFVLGPDVAELANPVLLADAVCVTMPPGQCSMQLQIRLFRGPEDLLTEVRELSQGSPEFVELDLGPLNVGDELLVIAVNESDGANGEAIALVEPLIVEN